MTATNVATPTPATSCQIQEYRNIGKAVIQGIEASGQYRFDQAWRLEGSIEYLNARDGSNDARLTDRPTWLGRMALQWHRDRWQADLRLRQEMYDNAVWLDSGNDDHARSFQRYRARAWGQAVPTVASNMSFSSSLRPSTWTES